MYINKYKISASIVLYNDKFEVLRKVLTSFKNSNVEVQVFLIDNSYTNKLKVIALEFNTIYIHAPINRGYGYANNLAIFHKKNFSNFHIVCNSDIYFNTDLINSLLSIALSNSKIGLIMPKILYPDGSNQNLVKTLPTPFTFVKKRILKQSDIGLITNTEDVLLNVPYLSGCFMFFNTDVLRRIGGFDEKFFLHFEDVDITRRVLDHNFDTLYFPKITVFHDHIIKKSTNFKMMKIYITSALYYFFKWGFIFDNKRKIYNNNIRVIT
jgi:GT2 family glycosyltransferase